MAIAFDAATDGGSTNSATSWTFSHTVGVGSNRLLVVSVLGDVVSGANDITGVTYAGQAMTLATSVQTGSGANRKTYLYYLLNPPTGANNVVITSTTAHFLGGNAASYTGVKQTGQPDATVSHGGSGSLSSFTTSITTVADNSWAILVENSYTANNPPTAGTGLTRRVFDATFGANTIFDGNGAITPAGAYSMTTSRPSSVDTINHIAASFAPDTGGGGATGKTPWPLLIGAI
jgi:hypothetical protein